MKTRWPVLIFAAGTLLALVGCATRSISQSSYETAYGRGWFGPPRAVLRELSEFEVLGIDPAQPVDDAEIARSLAASREPVLRSGARVLVVQSAAAYPDDGIVSGLRSAGFVVNGFTGVLPELNRLPVAYAPRETPGVSGSESPTPVPPASYARTLRLVAARGGYDAIVCVWGVLESERYNRATKTVSWVPVLGGNLPDEREQMRLTLKAAVIDVASGRWTFVTPEAVTASEWSSRSSRRETDQRLVADLKARGYAALATNLQQLASRGAAVTRSASVGAP